MRLKHAFITLGLVSMAIGGASFMFTRNNQMKGADASFVEGEKLYFRAAAVYQGNERFAAYLCNGDATATWVDMEVVNSGAHIYELTIPSTDSWANVIFCRMNGATTENNWDNRWDQTGDLVYNNTTCKGSRMYNASGSEGGTINGEWYVCDDVCIEGTPAPLSYSFQESYRLEFNPENFQYEKKGVSIAQGSEFFIHGTRDGYFRYADEYMTNDYSLFTKVDISNNIKTTKETSYDIYYKPLDSNHLWIEENALVAAHNWADSVNGSLYSICSVDGTSANHKTALLAEWEGWGTSFAALSIGAQGQVKTGDDPACVTFRNRYNHIVERYELTDFVFGGEPSNKTTTFVNNNALLIVAITSVSLLTACGLFFYIRKKKLVK